ncbi:MAG: hypothetical protein R2939_18690 [Kofleriaceae bacterium]
MHRTRALAFLSLAGLVACGSSPPATGGGGPQHQAAGLAVEVEVSSVSLADDCGDLDGGLGASSAIAERSSMAADCAPDADCGGGCEQTTMQLTLSAADAGPATQVEVIKVELVDGQGAVVGVLTPRTPRLWDGERGVYVAWDGAITAGQDIAASVDLSAPDWGSIPGGRWGDGGTLAARVTLSIGGETVVRSSSATAVAPDPMVVT